ncbi:UNVERIFIED_CONTAM: hypothetical protein PYX00_007410 [Menopon gallinae]|uniref:BRCT domain-containing protein n=1 Tax=Menopon gallinae TaxID=328185 RepID=A0AAW2HK06_9NEOP
MRTRKEVEVKTVLPAPNKVVPETVKKITSKASNRRTIPFALLGKIQKKKNSSTLFVKLGRLSANIARSHAAVVKIIFPSATKKAKKPITSAVGCQTDPVEEVVQTDKKKDSADVEIQTIQTQSVKEVQTSQIEQKTVHVQTSDSENFTMSGMFKDFNTPVMTREEKMDVDMDINTELQCELNKTWATQEQKNPQEKGSKGEEEVIDLVSRDSSDISRVMDNINLDLARVRAIRSVKPVSQHRDEESDSDIFIEQTPPKNVSMRKDVAQEESQASFLMISGVPEEKSVLIHDENNQNEMNQFKKPARKEVTKRICIASSGVINRKNIDKFVSKFGVEHLSAPRKDMTHLIVGLHENDEEERVPYCTPKLLYAIANKKWVVTEEWIEKCLEENKFVPEEQYESVDPAGGNGCAVARVSTGLLLGNCEVYLLGEYDRISKQEFSGLIEDCGGKIVRHPGEFSYSAGKIRMILADSSDNIDKEEVKRLVKKTKTLVMSRDVIIVSIQSYKLTNFVPFLLHFPATADPVNWGYPADLLKGVDDESLDDEMCSWT